MRNGVTKGTIINAINMVIIVLIDDAYLHFYHHRNGLVLIQIGTIINAINIEFNFIYDCLEHSHEFMI